MGEKAGEWEGMEGEEENREKNEDEEDEEDEEEEKGTFSCKLRRRIIATWVFDIEMGLRRVSGSESNTTCWSGGTQAMRHLF